MSLGCKPKMITDVLIVFTGAPGDTAVVMVLQESVLV